MNLPSIQGRITAGILLTAILASTPSCGFIVFNDPDAETTAPAADDTTVSDTTSPDTEAPDTTDPEAPETTAPIEPGDAARRRLDALPDIDLSSTAIIIATTDGTTICPTEAADTVSSARLDSKMAVEEKFNTVIITNPTDTETLLADAKAAFNAGEYYADLIAIPQSAVGSFFAAGLLGNMYSLPYVEFDAEYYDKAISEESIAGRSLSAVYSSACFNPDYLSCVYFNRTIAEKCGLEDPYAIVRDGRWTWDKLGELAISATDTINGIGGHVSSLPLADYVDLAAASQQVEYISNIEGIVPTVGYLDSTSAGSRIRTVIESMYELIYEDGTYRKETDGDARDIFLADQALFLVDRMYFMTWIPDSETEWGILPLPKYSSSQTEYLSPLAADAPVFCVLGNTPDFRNSGLILEALSLASHEYVAEAYVNDRINYYLRDSASIDMLEAIVGSATTDFAHMYASGFANLANSTYTALTKAVTTKSTIDTLYKNYKNTANRELAAKIKVAG